jgi:hypothetical protein
MERKYYWMMNDPLLPMALKLARFFSPFRENKAAGFSKV